MISHSLFTPQPLGSRTRFGYLGMMLFLLLFVASGSGVMAQSSSHTITGRVFDGDLKEWIVGGSVRVLTPKDSTLVKGALTDQQGRFRVEGIGGGSYIVQVSFLGFETIEKSVTLSDKKEYALGTLTMKTSATNLKEVQVVGQATPMTLKKDTVQFNADAFRVRQGASVEELLRRIPGMEIDDNGGITYNGETISRLEVDGRNFFSSTPTIATKNLPSNIVQNVQVVDKKSERTRMTGMDNGSKEKVLNLQLKEDKKRGFLTNTNLGYGTKDRYKADLMGIYFNNKTRYTLLANLNNTDGVSRGRGDYTMKNIGLNVDNTFGDKLNITADVSYNDRDTRTITNTNTENILRSGVRNYEVSTSDNLGNSKDIAFSSRVEWKPTDRTLVFIEPSANYGTSRSIAESQFDTKDISGSEINRGTSYKESKSGTLQAGGRLFARYTLNDAGRNVFGHFSVNYSNADGSGFSNSVTDFLSNGSQQVIDQQTMNDERGIRYSTGFSYLEPFSDRWGLQLNYNFDLNDRSSQQLAYNKDASGSYTVLDTDYSRGSQNRTADHRLGGQVRYKFWDKSFLYLGFDANPSTTHTITTDGAVEIFNQSRTVWNYAPSFNLDINPSDSVRINMRYSGRTGYPSMTQLNPVVVISSPLSRVEGNPGLLPSFTHNLDVHAEISNRSRRQSFQVFGSGGITNNAVVSKRTTDETTGTSVTTYENVDGEWNAWYGFTVSTPIGGPKSKWSSFTFGNLMYNKNKGFVNGELNTSDNFAPRLNQRFSWSGDNIQVTTGIKGTMSKVKNSISTDLNRTTYDYWLYNELVWNLPYDLVLSNRIGYQNAHGYNDDIKRELLLWDMTLSWSFLRGKNATIELSGYDLLGQRTNVDRRVTANAITDTVVNGTTSYVMLTFSYRFNTMGSGAPRYGEYGESRGPRLRGFGGGRPPVGGRH